MTLTEIEKSMRTLNEKLTQAARSASATIAEVVADANAAFERAGVDMRSDR